ncbi:MAG: cation:proton antiporter [Chloroflexi bacterium]|nr:cation:proton antiporter [Chloroflexota bacterium]
MEGLTLAVDLIVVLGIALVAGVLLHLLRQPPVLGYILAGVAIGPFGLRLVRDTAQVHDLADLGIALLMFALGVEFSLAELRRVGRIAVLGGVIQIAVTAALGLAVASGLRFPVKEAIFFGMLVAISSTMIALKTLMERGEADSLHGRIALGILIIQDLSVVPMLVFLESLTGSGQAMAMALLLAALKAVLFLGVALFLGMRVVPWLLARIAAMQSRELFLLAIVALSLGTAFGTQNAGQPLAFGAIMAGLIISESDLADQALAEIVPLRDTFATIFFTSIGMLMDLRFIGANLVWILVIVAAVIVGKFFICGAIAWFFGYPGRTSILVGASLIQVGEFSFILGRVGLEADVLSDRLFSLTLASALITIALTPAGLSWAHRFTLWLDRVPAASAWLAARFEPERDEAIGLTQHVVICGMGSVGRQLARALERRDFSYLVIDLDFSTVSNLRQRGITCIYGDASNPVVLERAGLERARVLVLAMPDQAATELAIRHAHSISPKLDIIARVQRDSGLQALKGMGASELVQPHHEAGFEIVRHTLHRYGLTTYEIQHLISTLREESQA